MSWLSAIGDAVNPANWDDMADEAIETVSNAVSGAYEAVEDGAVDFVNNVAAPIVNDVIEAGESYIEDVTPGFLSSLGAGLSQFVDGFGDAFGMFAGGLKGATVDAFGMLMSGDFRGAATAAINGVDDMIFRAPVRAANGVINSVEDLLNAPTYLLGDTAGGFIRDQIVARTVDIGRGIFNTTADLGRNFGRLLMQAPADFVLDIGTAAGHLFRGEFADAAGAFGMAFVNLGGNVGGHLIDQLMVGLQGAADVVGTALFLHEPSRPLTDDEKAALREIYGDSMDYDSIRVHEDNITTQYLGLAPHTVGNDIYIPREVNGVDQDGNPFTITYVDSNGELTDRGEVLMVHEAAHTWQSQNGGNDYIGKALWSQFWAAAESGFSPDGRNGAYDWRQGVAEGKSFGELNPEQQAELIEEIAEARVDDGVVTADDWDDPDTAEDESLSAEELAFVLDAWAQVQAGRSAP